MNTTLCLVILILTIIYGSVAADSNCTEYVSIDSTEDCAKLCPFLMLEEAMRTEPNHYRLWTAFHPPREAFPQLLVVHYDVTDNHTRYNMTDTYLWSSNAIYFVIPPHIFGLLSLFLGVLDEFHTGEVYLTLPCECACWLEVDKYNESDNSTLVDCHTDDNMTTLNYLEVLTEKVWLVLAV